MAWASDLSLHKRIMVNQICIVFQDHLHLHIRCVTRDDGARHQDLEGGAQQEIYTGDIHMTCINTTGTQTVVLADAAMESRESPVCTWYTGPSFSFSCREFGSAHSSPTPCNVSGLYASCWSCHLSSIAITLCAI